MNPDPMQLSEDDEDQRPSPDASWDGNDRALIELRRGPYYRFPVQDSISPGLASLMAGLCYGFVLGIVFSLIVKAVLS